MTEHGTSSTLVRLILCAALGLVLIVFAAWVAVQYHEKKALAVYYELLAGRATVRQITARLGPPIATVTSQQELHAESQGWSPPPRSSIESKVLVYETRDQPLVELRVFLYLDRRGTLRRVEVAGT